MLIELIALFIAWNGLVFSVYFVDKQAARYGGWRVSENTLLMLALLAGSPGAVAAQQMLRHKTRKEPFRSILMAIAAFHFFMLIATPVAVFLDHSGALTAFLQRS